MYSKWIKSGFILAVLLVSMVSLSMAACPWFIKNEFYSAQCGVLKEVPASKGLLANDPGATAILEPAGIKIAPEYGTLVVNADGSFVYDPNPDMQSGTYVTFKYNATNGACAAKYAGIAKIQVSCKCRPNVKDLTLCLTPATTLDEIKQKLIEAGVDCIGCGVAPTVLDLSEIELAPGRYPYLLKCPGCQDALGWVTLVPGCAAQAPPMEFCAGSVTMANLPGMIQAACVGTGCGVPVIDYGNVTEENGFVSGGYYVAICNRGTECESRARGDITVFPKCVVNAPPIEICEEKTLGELEDEIEAEGPGCTGVGCDATPVLSYENVIVDEETGFVTGGSYTVTCTTSKDCVSSANGAITVVPKCEVIVQGLQGACFTPAQLQENITALNPAPCGTCDSTPVFDFPVWDLDEFGNVAAGIYEFTITCDAGPDDCESEGIGVAIIEGCLPPECPCEAIAPNLCFNIVCSGEGESKICRTYSYNDILTNVTEMGGVCDGPCSEMALKFYRGVQEIDYTELVWKFPADYLYKVVCNNSDGTCAAQSAKAYLDVRYDCGC